MTREDQIAEIALRWLLARPVCRHCGKACGYVSVYCAPRAAEVLAELPPAPVSLSVSGEF